MPIYEYQCQACEYKQEIMHRISEEPSKECSSCGKNELKKLISAVGFQLKGTGWYETDFKNKGTSKAEGSSGDPSSNKKASDNKDSSSTQQKSNNTESKSTDKKSDSSKSSS